MAMKKKREEITLDVSDVSVRYKIGDFKDIGLKEWTMRHLTNNYHVQDFMAVDGVHFQLKKGDMLGIIGSNGAGKSTLLKAISGIMEPTLGSITANGNVVALLELASGFDGNLTVRENAYLRGAMLGYTRAFMDETYEKILDFSELRDFEERPFKQLSSGMQSRLAFSIASLVQPDILILDEVLSVGDGAFREKSACKMREIINGGATTILVSHSLLQIRELCNKVLWLDHGKQVDFGETQEICDRYEAFLNGGNVISKKAKTAMERSSNPYDYIIVGAGLTGAVFAYEMTKRNKKCLVLERRNQIGGNIYTEAKAGIQVHCYGAHIFHTSRPQIWSYVNQFVPFKNFINSPLAVYKGNMYNLPFNMNTFLQLWGAHTPEEARAIIDKQIEAEKILKPDNLEEYALSTVGRDIYEKLIQGYTEKQWGRPCSELPSNILKRIPLRFTYDNNYFNDRFQGIPTGGYTKLVEKLLHGIDIRLDTSYEQFQTENPETIARVLYTGPIDEYYHYSLGHLDYRSLHFETQVLRMENYQGNAVVNYTERGIPFTRIIEHKHFDPVDLNWTVITKEYPETWEPGKEAYYPINDSKNSKLLHCYRKLAEKEENVIFAGRLGTYRYMNMDAAIEASLRLVETEIKREESSKHS